MAKSTEEGGIGLRDLPEFSFCSSKDSSQVYPRTVPNVYRQKYTRLVYLERNP